MITRSILTDAEKVLKEIEVKSLKGFLPIIGPVKGKYLTDAVLKYKVKKVLEVGTLVAYSAILIASTLPEDGQIITLEINPRSAEMAKNNIRKANLTDKINILVGDALDLIPEINQEFDMVFLDAAKSEYFDYLKLCEPRLKKNGVVVSDNVKIFADQMQDFLDYLRNSGKYDSQYFDVGFDGVEVSVKLF